MKEIKQITSEVLPTILSWFEQRPDFPSPPRDMLPGGGLDGFVVYKDNKPITATFVYPCQTSLFYWVGWLVADIDYRESDRNELITELLEHIDFIMKKQGYKYAIAMSHFKELRKSYTDAGYHYHGKVDELFKILK